MLRFGTPASNRRLRPAGRERARLWMLFAAACAVMFAIRMLGEPETAERIDSIFLPPEQSTDSPATINEVLGGRAEDVQFGSATTPAEVDSRTTKDSPAQRSRFDLSSVRDNTYFRSEENTAWFAVFDWLRKDPSELRNDSIAGVTYAQFIDQPDVYRGQVVTVKGTVEREELLDAPANDIGIERYRRLILRPAGGGVWPIVVYSLELPPGFPRGADLTEDATVTGVFFKNWSYSWQGGLGLAPVVLAKTFDWHPKVTVKRPRARVSIPGLIAVGAAAAAIATIVGWLAWRHTRRPSDVLSHRAVIAPPPEES